MHPPTLANDLSFCPTLASASFQPLLSCCARCFPSKSRVLGPLRTLFLSCRSFRRSPRLFSISCELFLQNTGGWGTSATSPRLSVIICLFFVAPLFSWSYKLLFPQVFYFDNYLRCPPGCGVPRSSPNSVYSVPSVVNPPLRFSFSSIACYRARQQGGFAKCQ